MKTPSNGKVARGKVAKRSNGNGHTERSARGKLQLPVLAQQKASGKFGCSQCGLCCTYLAIEIDGPTSVKRATELLWYLYHQDVSLYLNDDSWMIQFETTCRHLTADRRCGVYATRPHICREFSEQECEVNTGDDGQTFYTVAAFMDYLKKAKPRIHKLVMKDYAPAPEPGEVERVHPFERRLRDVYVRRAAALAPAPSSKRVSPPKAATRTSLPLKKSRSSSASADTL
jgi:Fe-S-cluster containining protein